MYTDVHLLAVLGHKEFYDKYLRYIKQHTINSETKVLIDQLESYYKDTGVTDIDWSHFGEWFKLKNYHINRDKLALYEKIFENLIENDYEETKLYEDIIYHFANMDYIVRLNDLSIRYLEGDTDISIDDLNESITGYKDFLDRHATIDDIDNDYNFVPHDINEVLDFSSHGAGLEWRLEELNVSCGPLRQGDFVEVAAYVDTGKTTFLASEVTHMAQQLPKEKVVLWINNEEQGRKIRSRLYQATLGKTEFDILGDVAGAKKEYERLHGRLDKILIVDDDTLSYQQLDAILKKLGDELGLVVIDVMDKIKGHENAQRDDIRLQKIYQWGRSVAKKYCPVLATSQVDGTGAGIRWIKMNQLQGAKVAKQSEADAIITIGTDEDGTGTKRYIHIPKNKLSGGPRSREEERKGYWEVEIQPSIARYKGYLSR